jgi:hypothetical protein
MSEDPAGKKKLNCVKTRNTALLLFMDTNRGGRMTTSMSVMISLNTTDNREEAKFMCRFPKVVVIIIDRYI